MEIAPATDIIRGVDSHRRLKSLPMICISIAQESRTLALVDMLNAVALGADMIELRLDTFEKDPNLAELFTAKRAPILMSCRRPEDGGAWDGSEEERLMLLRNAVISKCDFVEIELDAVIEPQEVVARLALQAPIGLHLLEAKRVPLNASAVVVGLCYAADIPLDRLSALRERIAETLAAEECLVERLKPERRQVNIRPFLRELSLAENGRLEMHLHLLPAGTARPDEVMSVLGLGDLVDAGIILERTRLNLRDETDQSTLTAEPAVAHSMKEPT